MYWVNLGVRLCAWETGSGVNGGFGPGVGRSVGEHLSLRFADVSVKGAVP